MSHPLTGVSTEASLGSTMAKVQKRLVPVLLLMDTTRRLTCDAGKA